MVLARERERNLSMLDCSNSRGASFLNTLAQPFAAEMRETLKKRLARFVPKPQQNSQPDVCGGTMQPGPYDRGPSSDAFGGGSSSSPRARHENTTDDDRNVRVANNKNVAREREMRRLVTWTDSGMQVRVRGDGVDDLPPINYINYQYLVPCQDILMLAGFIHNYEIGWFGCRPRDLYFVQGQKNEGLSLGLCMHLRIALMQMLQSCTAMVAPCRLPI